MKFIYMASLIKNRFIDFSRSRDGFVILHVLLYFHMFLWTVSYLTISKGTELIQRDYYQSAVKRIETEKKIIRLIRTGNSTLFDGSLMIDGQIITVEYDGIFIVSICDDFCYRMIVEYDRVNDVILRLDYE